MSFFNFSQRDWVVIVCAYLVAPLSASVGFGLVNWYTSPNDFYTLLEIRGWYKMFAPNVYVTTVAYVVTLILGIPFYLLLRKLNLDKGPIIVAAASIIGLIFSYFFRFGSSQWDWEWWVLPSIFVSLLAVAILKLGKVNPQNP